MSDLALEFIKTEEANAVLHARYQDRLRGLERDLVNVRADVKLAKDAGTPNVTQEERLAELERQIRTMREERDKVKPNKAS
jgi:hypothetical protein